MDIPGFDQQAVAQFVGNMLHAVTQAHLLHLQTRSYAEHVALGEFYEGLGELVDRFAETLQGTYDFVLQGYPEMYPAPRGTAKDFLRGLRAYVLRERQMVPGDSHLANIIDEIAAHIDRAVYKVSYLA